jgi:hypothetical protein
VATGVHDRNRCGVWGLIRISMCHTIYLISCLMQLPILESGNFNPIPFAPQPLTVGPIYQ